MKSTSWFFLALLACPGFAAEPASTTNRPSVESTALRPGLVAQVNQLEVPYEWYANEFRATYYQHAGASDVRREVMDGLIDRLVLYDVALASGVTNDPAVQADLERQLKGMEEFMRYQLAMARVGLTIEAYLEKHPPPETAEVTADDLRAYYVEEIAGQPGAPSSYDDLEPAYQQQVREQVEGQRLQAVLQKIVAGLRTNATIRINERLMDSTPMPKMQGDGTDDFLGAP